MLKKRFPLMLIGLLTLAFGLVACQATSSPTPEATPEAVVTLAPTTAAASEGGDPAAGQGYGPAAFQEHGTMAGPQGEHGGPPEDMNPAQGLPTPENTNLSPEEIADLLKMREEEKLARDVYLTLYEKWGSPVFSNIARSEQMHMDAMGVLLEHYGLDDPVAQTGDARGVFSDPQIQDLYNQLVEQGSASLEAALTVGATIEDLDIKDLNEAIARTTHADIQTVYERLRTGSYHHMQAFVGNLRAQGADYTPQFISAEEFQRILSEPHGGGGEHGRGHGQGHGPGQGQGNYQEMDASVTPTP